MESKPRTVRCGHIQASNPKHDGSPADIKEAMIQKHIPMVEEAGKKGVQILCLQEIFHGPYFCAEQGRSGNGGPKPGRDKRGERRLAVFQGQKAGNV